jgi:hypothetical protein
MARQHAHVNLRTRGPPPKKKEDLPDESDRPQGCLRPPYRATGEGDIRAYVLPSSDPRKDILDHERSVA